MSPSRHWGQTFVDKLFCLFLCITIVLSQSTTTPSPPSTTTPGSASIVPSTAQYTYIGCYNETTSDSAAGDVRALAGGNMTAKNNMTINYCLSFCGANTYAGLEYSRECWCASSLNTNSAKLSDANCSLPCEGDGSEICGGALKLTVYQHKSGTSSSSGSTIANDRRILGVSYTLLIMIFIGLYIC